MNLYLHHTYSSLLSQNKRYISPEQLLPYVLKIPFPFFSFHYSPSLLVLPSQHINMFKSLPSLLNITLTSSHDSLFSFPSLSNFPFHRHGKLVCTSFFYFLFFPWIHSIFIHYNPSKTPKPRWPVASQLWDPINMLWPSIFTFCYTCQHLLLPLQNFLLSCFYGSTLLYPLPAPLAFIFPTTFHLFCCSSPDSLIFFS